MQAHLASTCLLCKLKLRIDVLLQVMTARMTGHPAAVVVVGAAAAALQQMAPGLLL